MSFWKQLFGGTSAGEVTSTPHSSSKPSGVTDNGDGTITDHSASLMWQKDDDGTERNYQDAVAYCRTLSLGGHSDWRLPSLGEFDRLKSATQGRGLGIVAHCSLSTGSSYWTSTPGPQGNVAYVADGTTMFKTNTYPIRAVRGVS